MMSKRFLPVIFLLTAISVFIAFQSQGRSDQNDDPKSRHAKVIKNVGVLLEEGHYSPKIINDAFSKSVMKKFVEELDDEKNIFIQSDLDGFKKYATVIDDEIHGQSLESFYAIHEVYTKRLNEIADLFPSLLSKPFNFSVDEKLLLNPDKAHFPKTLPERYETWRKKIKYMVLGKYIDLLDEQEKNKDSVGYAMKADSTLERQARDQIRKQLTRYFNTKKNHETQDENFSVFVNTITGLMDPHTNYFPPVDLRSFNESMSGRFYGIGAQLREDDGKIKISSLVSGGPAWKSGQLKDGDEILKVGQGNEEPVDVTGYAVSDAVKLIRGAEQGSEVRLTVKSIDGSVKVVILLRDEINPEESRAKSAIIKGQYPVGYIYLPEFYADFERQNGNRCAADVAKEIDKLKNEKVEGIIIDLRGNGGGSLYDVVQMAGLFISKGPICQVKGRDERANILQDRDDRIQYDGPLVVMVDGTSASASEIFAAAIQDYKRGLVIGSSSTYGKGTVQRNIPLNPDGESSLFYQSNTANDLGSIKLTLQKFYRINGGATQLKGVTPDIILPDRYDYLKFREKDNPEALRWDEITPASYELWTKKDTYVKVINDVNKEVNSNQAFVTIREQVKWLDQYNDKEFSLQLTKYKEEQKQLKNVFKKLDDSYKLSDSLIFINNAADTGNINASEEKQQKNKQWIQVRSKDIFIDESVKAINRMISNRNLVRRED